mmetsp:Transcript_60493/g.168982  ORF Transcript_60493/g.168982 Transcript_60493/m.168982 type:complete len:158 (-) Transcript_60493:18-491(-)
MEGASVSAENESDSDVEELQAAIELSLRLCPTALEGAATSQSPRAGWSSPQRGTYLDGVSYTPPASPIQREHPSRRRRRFQVALEQDRIATYISNERPELLGVCVAYLEHDLLREIDEAFECSAFLADANIHPKDVLEGIGVDVSVTRPLGPQPDRI